MLTTLLCAFALSGRTQAHTLWQIGAGDGTGSGFAFAPDRFGQYRTDPAYAVGISPADAWPYVLPGPQDSWAGSRIHRDSVYFGLAGVISDCRFICDLLDTHRLDPPDLSLWVNGRKVSSWQSPSGSGDRSIFGHPELGRHARWMVNIPGSMLEKGFNELEIRNDRGSWALFDELRLEGQPALALEKIAPQIQLRPVPQSQIILRTPNGPKQPVEFEVLNFSQPGELDISGAGQWHGPIGIGSTSVALRIPPVRKGVQAKLRLTLGGRTFMRSIDVEPVRPWDVYLLPHSHVDIGYTDLQSIVAAMHRRNLFDAIAVAKESASFPTDDRYRFNGEATWTLDNLRLSGTRQELAQVAAAFRAGIMDSSANYCNVLTALMRPEELMRCYGFSDRLRDWFGIDLRTATQTDVPGVTWGAVAAMSQAGIKSLILMPNPSDRIGGVLSAWQDKPFYWVSPSGKERVLVWETASYGVAHGLRGFNGDRTRIFRTADPTKNFIEGYVFNRLRQLADEGYPYDCIAFPWSGTDNFPIDGDVAKAARHWNATYVTPHVVVSTFTGACDRLVKRFGNKIPVVRGDFSPYWEDGAGSSANETAMNRASADRLIQAETLCAMTRPAAYDPAAFWQAWRNVILYSEHTWGAYNSTSEPDAESVKQEWAYKQAYAVQADKRSRELVAEVTRSPETGRYSVVNTTSWPRTDLVVLSAQQSQSGDRVINENGVPVPSQRLRSGELAILATNVPAFGAIRLTVTSGAAFTGPVANAALLRLSSPDWQIDLQDRTFRIIKLWNKRLRHDFARKPYDLNRYFRLPGSDLGKLETARNLKCAVVEPGPLVASVRITSEAEGTRGLTQEIRLVAGLDSVDLIDTIDKLPVREKEGVHFAFPFDVPNGRLRIQGPWAVFRPDVDQIPGSNKNWLNTQYFADISNDGYGVTWSSLDAPLLEVGGITANMLDGGFNPNQWIRHLGQTQTIYSWALNNHWYTNYRADQMGRLKFRYGIRAHGKYAPDAAYRFGVGLAQPLVVASAIASTPLLKLDDSRVVVTALKPSEDKKALIVRLWCVGDKPASVKLNWRPNLIRACTLSSSSEHALAPTGTALKMAGWQVVTVRAELASAH